MAKGGAHDARLTADQLLVHVQGHGGGGVGEAQSRAAERERSRDVLNRCKIIIKRFTFRSNEVKKKRGGVE